MNNSPEEMMQDVIENANCACCGASGSAMQRCSACKYAFYCSKTCQKSHWPQHKPRCKQIQQSMKTAKESGNKRSVRLLQNWKEQIRNGIFEGALLYHFGGLKKLRMIQNKKNVVRLSIAFDFNLKTFMPTSEPETMPLESFGQQIETIEKLYDEMQGRPGVTIVVWLQLEGPNPFPSIVPCHFEDDCVVNSKRTWDDSMLLFREVKVSSSKFDSWNALQMDNIKLQLQEGIRNHSQFQPFLANALQLESKNQLHKTSVIVVHFEFGFGLGEIKRLKSFELMAVDKMIEEMKKAFGESHPQVEYYKTDLLDFDNSPTLLRSRIMHPYNILVPVFFLGKPALFGMPNFLELMPGHNVFTTKQCTKKAEKAFAALQKLKLPKVGSPELD